MTNAAVSGSLLGPQPGGRTRDSSRDADISLLIRIEIAGPTRWSRTKQNDLLELIETFGL